MGSLNCLTTQLKCQLLLLAEIIHMVVFMAEDKLRFNDMNTIYWYMKWMPASHSLSGYHSNSLIVH